MFIFLSNLLNVTKAVSTAAKMPNKPSVNKFFVVKRPVNP